MNDVTETKDYVGEAGKPLEAGKTIATEAEVIEALKLVEDPELMLNIYDMGLIYKIDIATNGDVRIDMTLTAPGCPVADELPKRAAEAVATLPGVGKTFVQLVWEPAWTPERMSEDARMMLEIF